MLNINDIQVSFDKDIFKLSQLVIRELRDKLDSGEVYYEPVIQFQVTNNIGVEIVDLKVELNFYSSSSKFLGSESDFKLDPLLPNEKETFSLTLEPPDNTSKCELMVKGKKYGLRQKANSLFGTPYFLIAIVALLFISNIKN